MALIGTIRRNSWLLFVMIALALAAFLIMDMVGNSSRYQAGNLTLGEINGEKVDYRNFMAHEEAVYAGGGSDVYSRRSYLWNYYLNKTLFDREAEANGIGVGREELLDLEFGSNLSPVVQQRFTNPNTGGVDFQQLNNIRQQIQAGQMPEETKRFWAWQEKEIIADRKQRKVENLAAKAFYTPSWLIDRLMDDQNNQMEFSYVKIPFNEADASSLEVTTSQIQNYLEENRSEFARDEEGRRLEYMTLNVTATATDSAEVKENLRSVLERFKETDNDTTFIQNNEGVFTSAYQFKEELPAIIADSVFEKPVGSFVGPYEVQGSIRATKIVDRKMIPDSVHARHILFNGQTQQQLMQGFQTADSLMKVIESGQATFDSLAIKHSQGPSAPRGGDLGYAARGQMVQQFNDLIFYRAEIGELYTVATQFGVHLVEVLDKKFINNQEGVQLATVQEEIVPSQRTQDSIYNIAQEFISNARTLPELKKAIADRPEFRIQEAQPSTKNGYLFASFGGGNVSRDIIRWAFENSTEEGDVSPIVYSYQNPQLFYIDRYVIVGLNEILPEGLPDPESVRLQVEQTILDKLKGEQIASQISNATSLESIASQFNVTVDSIGAVNFMSDNIPDIGREPKLLAAVKNTELNQLSKPVIGNTGVFVAKPTNVSQTNSANFSSVQNNSVSQMAQQVNTALSGALKENAEIEDNRSDFY
ncbi:peptidylprolyl isomerase [Membranihabitans maritimus]|uniref:peptidylprolyl isomerase n=1 Tax=Membranihabitans maritimus TaxID=2904244 RepID=UPI001F1D649E|nr:peptidylprolyl isomerase [Membranihabitans maritimus]